jgi:hypothetical protein
MWPRAEEAEVAQSVRILGPSVNQVVVQEIAIVDEGVCGKRDTTGGLRTNLNHNAFAAKHSSRCSDPSNLRLAHFTIYCDVRWLCLLHWHRAWELFRVMGLGVTSKAPHNGLNRQSPNYTHGRSTTTITCTATPCITCTTTTLITCTATVRQLTRHTWVRRNQPSHCVRSPRWHTAVLRCTAMRPTLVALEHHRYHCRLPRSQKPVVGATATGN